TFQEAKAKGSQAWKDGDLQGAIKCFSNAIELDPTNASGQLHVYYSNRSAAQLKDNNIRASLLDAEECVKIDPTWAKGFSRLGTARFRLGMYALAAEAYTKGLELEPTNDEMRKNLLEAQRQQTQQSTGRTQAGSRQQSFRDYMKKNPSQSIQFLLRGFLLINLVLFLLPLHGMSSAAYQRMIMSELVVSVLSLHGRHGMPKFNKQYLTAIITDTSMQTFITALLFLTQRPYIVGVMPIVLLELVDFMWFLSGALHMVSPRTLRALDVRIEKVAPALFGVTNWTSRRLEERWQVTREKAAEWSSSMEVMFAIMLVVELLLPRRHVKLASSIPENVIMLALYWQTLRMKYMLDTAYSTQRTRAAFRKVDVRIMSVVDHPKCPRFLG
ncbi:unnamed protein product, partial [Discosporangium mesarthrocarpum]